jgi:exportin-5
MSATIGEPFYRSIGVSSLVLALMENIQSMEFRHMRQLIHLVLVPVIKNCPVDLWEVCVVNLLHPLLSHCHEALVFSWTGLLREGRVKLPDNLGNLSGNAITWIILVFIFYSLFFLLFRLFYHIAMLNEELRHNS